MLRIDAHTHIGSLPDMETAKEWLLEGMDEAGIDLSIVSNVDASEEDCEAAKGRSISSLEALQECLDFKHQNEGKIAVLYWVKPKSEAVSEEIVSFLKKHKDEIKGLKFHPFATRLALNDDLYLPYVDLAISFGWPILVHTASDVYSRFSYLAELAKKRPSATFVSSHLELYGDSFAAIDMMENVPNILADTAWVNEEVARRFIDRLGPSRLMFGTDSPVGGEHTVRGGYYDFYLENRLGLSEPDFENLMGLTAKRVYKL